MPDKAALVIRKPVIASTQAKKQRPELWDLQDVVTIHLGNGKVRKTYPTFKAFACYFSPMLDKAFNGPFVEGETQSIDMEDFEIPSAFGVIQAWMYTQSLCSSAKQFPPLFQLYAAWVLSDRLVIPQLQNELLRQIRASGGFNKLTFQEICWVYRSTSSESKLRQLLVWQCAWITDEKRMDVAVRSGQVIRDLYLDVSMLWKRDALACRRDYACRKKLGYRCVKQLNWKEYEVSELAL